LSAYLNLTAEGLASWVKDPVVRDRYIEAFRRSDFEAMLNYYRRNYPREPYTDIPLTDLSSLPSSSTTARDTESGRRPAPAARSR
jgi:hypothetical protein